MMANDLQKLLAEFAAKGGEVKKLPPSDYKPTKELAKTGAEQFFEHIGKLKPKKEEPTHTRNKSDYSRETKIASDYYKSTKQWKDKEKNMKKQAEYDEQWGEPLQPWWEEK
jgi:hypothetical protein